MQWGFHIFPHPWGIFSTPGSGSGSKFERTLGTMGMHLHAKFQVSTFLRSSIWPLETGGTDGRTERQKDGHTHWQSLFQYASLFSQKHKKWGHQALFFHKYASLVAKTAKSANGHLNDIQNNTTQGTGGLICDSGYDIWALISGPLGEGKLYTNCGHGCEITIEEHLEFLLQGPGPLNLGIVEGPPTWPTLICILWPNTLIDQISVGFWHQIIVWPWGK
jgi:hypothetical protein